MRFQTLLSWGAAGEGPSPRPRLPLLPGRRRLEEGSTASAAAAPLPRVPVGAALPPPTCHWLRHAHHIHPRHTSHTHITHTHHSHAAHTCTYTSHAHTTALQAGRGGGGRGRTPWPASSPRDVQAPRHHLVGRADLPSCPLWAAWFRHSWVGPPPAQRASSSRLGVQSPDCPLSEDKPVAPGSRCGPGPAQRRAQNSRRAVAWSERAGERGPWSQDPGAQPSRVRAPHLGSQLAEERWRGCVTPFCC